MKTHAEHSGGVRVRPGAVGSRAVSRVLAAFLVAWSASMPISAGTEAGADARVLGVKVEEAGVRVRLDGEAAYRVFTMSHPPRIVLEFDHATYSDDPLTADVGRNAIKRVRAAQFRTAPTQVARVVLDMESMQPYAAEHTGDEVVLRVGAASDQTAQAVEGEAGASVLATAKRAARGRDLMASLPNTPVTVDFENADVRDVLRVLSEMSEINIIHGADVAGFLTIHLDEVPFDQAFNTILTMQGLVAQQMGDNVLRVMTPATLAADRSRAVTVYKTFTLNYARASDVQQHLASVRISPNGKITVDERTNSLVVTDTPEGLSAAQRLIAELDQKPRQVLIEAKMVEIILNDSMDLGVQWEYSNLNQTANGAQTIGLREPKVPSGLYSEAGTFNEEGVNFVRGDGSEVRSLTSLERGTGVSLPGPQEAAITFGFINNTDLLSVTLNALATKGLTKVLSSPKVITVNNQEAKIQVGSKLPFSSLSVTAGGTVTQSITFLDIGILLTVTPTISADNRVRLKVKPEVSFPGSNTAAGPEINTRNAETEVMIRDGETLVIGGLIDEQTRQDVSKVPLLGDIPVLGTFFRNNSDSKRRSELLVFLTPNIVVD